MYERAYELCHDLGITKRVAIATKKSYIIGEQVCRQMLYCFRWFLLIIYWAL